VVKVSIEVRNGAARFSVAVRAESIKRVLSIAGERYPGDDVRIDLPVDPEGFFADGPADLASMAGFEQPERLAA
jgi:hypothetical protein